MYQLRNILCPTDFSESSFEAARLASFAIEPYHAGMTLLYVNEECVSPYWQFSHSPEKQHELTVSVEEFANNRLRSLGERIGPNIKYRHIVRHGVAYKEIVKEAEQNKYEMIVLATNGLGATSPHLIGRTAERIIRLSRVPILTIRSAVPPSGWKIDKILCPTDFSEYGNYALPYAISVALTFGASLILLHVTDIATGAPERLRPSFPDLQFYHERASEVTAEHIIDSDIDPENSIVRIAQQYDVGLIVMGTHGGRGIRRVQIGNTTEEVIRRVEQPVLSVTHPIHKVIFPYRFTEDYHSARDGS